ncbi:retention module-containing protein [Rhodoferax antarcticus]|uniref:Hemolysin-type calcium-binding domain protein n=1 Tax=Rhodoferax antarcticus ANT.BR TaxID=1111071 RepID=A0A1Q8YAG9_9BURK|nr:retention module-containing protein [Rhodoferax antarcticus]OLP04982.1 hemolysin-type calcium-binding domain protein [Rhodoferax antarcticus ANT.BR]
MATVQNSVEAKGIVVALKGNAWLVDPDGSRRLLKVGDEVQEGQRVVTENGAELELSLPNGQQVSVASARELLIDATLLGTAPLDATEAALKDLNSGASDLAQALAAGGDLLTELDPTAAGLTEAKPATRMVLLRVLRIVEAVDPLSIGRGPDDVTNDLNLYVGTATGLAEGEVPPVPGITLAPTITLGANITADDIINQAEAGQNIPITGVVAGDAKVGDTVTLTVNGNTFTGLVQAGKTFSIEVPGADLVADPDKTIQASVSTTDAAGNTASASDTEGYQVDTAPPVPTITLGANITADDIINQAEAGQNIPITGVVAGDAKVGDTVTLTVNGKTFTGLVQADKSFSINVPGADLVADPDKTIQASVSTTDAAGNTASASDTEGYGVDASAPAVTVDILDASLNVADRVSEVSFTFTQAPVGFTLDDITATNGTLSNLQPTSDLLVFTATFTANVGFEGDGQVSVAAGSYTNAAGNPGSAGSDTVNIDTTPPELSITLDANITADDIINQAEAGQNIPITGVVEGDAKVDDTVTLTVNGNTFTGLVQADKTFSINVPGADLVADPDKTIQASVSTTDAAGNTASASDTEGYQVDTAPPGDVYLTSQTKEIGNLGLSGEYFGHNDNRTGAANDTLYSGTTATRLHSDDGKFGNVDSLADVERIIEDRNGNADLVGSTASGAAKADATFSANKLEFGLHSGSNTPLFSNDLGQNGKVETGSIGAAASSGGANNLYNFLKVTSGNADALAATSGLGDTTDAVIRMVGYIYIPAGGAYDLRITADDGYRVRIGGQDLAQADYIQQTTTEVYSNQPISEGLQPIEILYWDQGGHASLRVEVKSSGTADATYKIIGNDEFALFSPSDLPVLTANQDIVESTTNGVWAVRTGETYTGTEASEKVIGSDGRDTIHTGAGNDTVNAGAGNDTVNAGDGADVISGGAGNDLLTGGLGSDTFVWALADQGIMGAPARDTITDFNTASHTAGGDVLDLRDLLTGENHTSGTGNLTSYLHFEKTGSDTVVHISSNGEFSGGFSAAKDVQTITLSGVDLIGSSSTDQQVIQSLLNNHKLITD